MKKFLIVALCCLFYVLPVNAKEVFRNDSAAVVVSGDLSTIGSEICIQDECFYLISSDDEKVTLLSKYNLYVGNLVDASYNYTKVNETFMQNSDAIGYRLDKYADEKYPFNATIAYSKTSNKYSGSVVENYVNIYKEKLENLGATIIKARIISDKELVNLGCDKEQYWCGNAPKWVYSTSYWVDGENNIARYAWYVDTYSYFVYTNYYTDYLFGVRPVIEIPVSSFSPSRDEENFYVDKLKMIESSDGVSISDDKPLSVLFNDLGQKVKYETVIYNNKDKNYYVRDIITKNIKNKFINVELDPKSENLVIEPNGSTKVTFYLSTLVEDGAGKELDDFGNVAFLISDRSFNPSTFSNIVELLLLIVILSGSVFVIYKKNKKLKKVLIILFIMFVGFNVYAEDFDEVLVDLHVKYESQNLLETTGISLNNKGSDYSTAVDVWAYSDKIKNVYIKSLISEPKKFYKKFDLTLNDNNRVLGYLVENNDNVVPYDLYIMANGVIKANEDSSFLFSFPNVESIDGLENIDFSETTSIKGMFLGNKKLKNVSFDKMDLANVKNISYVFYNSSVSNYDDLNIDNINNKEFMFSKKLYEFIKYDVVNDKELDYFNSDGNGNFVINNTLKNNYPIYYYRGSVSNNNVKLDNLCWKMVRTTDTGGIKLIYNGEQDKFGRCKSLSSTISNSVYNSMTSATGVGYMYGSSNSNSSFSNVSTNIYDNYYSAKNTYYYSTEVSYANGRYTLVNPESINYSTDGKNVTGYYSCLSGSTSCSTLYYVIETGYNAVYVVRISNGNDESKLNLTFYKDYKLNDDGSYSLSNKVVVPKRDYVSNYKNYVGYYYCDNETNCVSPSVVNSTSWLSFSVNSYIGYTYGNSYEYSNGKYILKDVYKSSSNKDIDFSKYSYSCGSLSDSCSTLLYLNHYNDGIYYISLTSGLDIDETLNNMFTNTNNSTIKTSLENWFSDNMIQYSNLLEDTIWYNDRSYPEIKAGMTLKNFSSYENNYLNKKFSGLNYKNKDDMFTVDNSKGNMKLIYPVGLITLDEILLAGKVGNENNYLTSKSNYWTMTPAYIEKNKAYNVIYSSTGNISSIANSSTSGVRPMISLKNDVIVTQGDGTVASPYVIEVN